MKDGDSLAREAVYYVAQRRMDFKLMGLLQLSLKVEIRPYGAALFLNEMEVCR